MKKHNFYAGPSILSEYTIKNTADAVMNFNETGLSILEISHRSKEFQAVIDEANAIIKELLEIPSGYEVLFLGGGASMQFCMIPYNFLKTKAAYLDTGVWASKAIKEATIALYKKCADYAYTKGIIIADTKFEFGLDENGQIVLGDEMLTPDSSRFWPLAGYEVGKSQPSYDKQYVRDWLKANPDSNYLLPQDVIDKTIEKYKEAYEKITGETF